MPDDSRAQDPAELAADGDRVLPGIDPPTTEEIEAHLAAEAVRDAQHAVADAQQHYADAAESLREIQGHDGADG